MLASLFTLHLAAHAIEVDRRTFLRAAGAFAFQPRLALATEPAFVPLSEEQIVFYRNHVPKLMDLTLLSVHGPRAGELNREAGQAAEAWWQNRKVVWHSTETYLEYERAFLNGLDRSLRLAAARLGRPLADVQAELFRHMAGDAADQTVVATIHQRVSQEFPALAGEKLAPPPARPRPVALSTVEERVRTQRLRLPDQALAPSLTDARTRLVELLRARANCAAQL